ncbi:BNR-4 repeat-containing protein [Alteromonas sp. KUL49]|uniref:BNR-4 repeat-containing protein n=1 Tax=Alteromonas sp. KUL49 TaxID=2480798 RepID=UPI00102F247B|nr:BNR-4 repeat-containing protein [Alteromonas sp. KUL49]TAP42265.1 hypothetical protein EYS00_01155 [Alteromonas sp. KUL49]GEA09856.1 hypothetical protein KUL49_02310 [Alteromonas sp. KUL49]
MKKTLLSIATLCLVQLGLAGCDATPSSEPSEQVAGYFADNGTGNPLAVVQHPAGEYHDGITYVSYQGPFEDPYVAAYNHEAKTWLGPFRAGTSELGRREGRTKFDNHGKPTLLIDDEGYIHIFYGGHGGDRHHGENTLGNVHHGANKHSISKRPFDITEWDEVDNISVFGTYNQALKMDNGDIYLFYRHGAHRSNWVYQRSTDNGRTFEAPVSFLKHKRRTDLKAEDSWYAWVGHGEKDEIIVTFDYHLCWDWDANERGHTTERHDAHYMVFNTVTGDWTNVQGESLNIPLTREEAEVKTLAMSTGPDWTFNGSTYLDTQGFPHITTNVGVDLGLKTGGPKLLRHLRWDGEQWLGGNSVNGLAAGNSRGDFILSGESNVEVILADDESGEVAQWLSNNNGETFTKGNVLLTTQNGTFAITSIIKNAHPDALVIAAIKDKASPHRQIYLLGNEGPIGRPLSEATLEKDTSVFY